MNKVALLKSRLAGIAHSLESHPDGLGLLALGSVGKETNRLDEFSDLDFFAIVKEGSKQNFIDDLRWLSELEEIVWCFRNTVDGYKLLYVDGVFCEFAVFEPQELAHIPYSEGTFIWKDSSISDELRTPLIKAPAPCRDQEYLLGELLSNLYVGLCRFKRGELCSAMRFIQVYAVDRLIELTDLAKGNPKGINIDDFCPDRRIEQRHPHVKELIFDCCLGARQSHKSAEIMLDYIEAHYEVSSHLSSEIHRLI